MKKEKRSELIKMRRIVEIRNERLEGGRAWRWFDTLMTVLAVVVFALAARGVLIEPVRVEGNSMQDTLQSNDYMFVEKLSYALSLPQRGDIVICYYPDAYYEQQNKEYYTRVKRVVAVEGDTVQSQNGVLYVNGTAVDEPYLSADKSKTTGIENPITIQKGEVFVLGDNRTNSNDSRNALVGPIQLEKIIGKPHFVLFPFSHIHGVTIWN